MNQRPLARQLFAALVAQWRVMLAVLPGVTLCMLNSTALDLPGRDFVDALASDRYRIQWIAGAYILGGAVGMALTSFFGRLLGLRTTYLAALWLFAIAAGACGFMNQVIWMTPFRLAQGLGMGLVISSGMVLIWRAFPQHKELAMAIYGMSVYLPSVLGSAAGGLLTAWISWRAIFLVNLPLGGLVWLTAWWLLPRESSTARAAGRFDWVGLVLLAASVVTLSVMVDLGQYWGWTASPYFVPWFVGGLVAVTALIGWGVFAAHPLINLRPLAVRHFGLGLAIKVAFSINLYVLLGLMAAYMIDLRGYQWWQGALVVLAGVSTMTLGLVVGTWLGNDANRKARMFLGLAVMAVATWQLAGVDVYVAKTWQAAILAVWGLGAGVVMGPALLTTFEGLSNEQTLETAGVFNIARSLPAFLISALLVTYVTRHADENFDWLRLDIRDNRPIVSETLRRADARFAIYGSPHDLAAKQSHALVGKWVHANSRAYAFQDAFRLLALAPCVGLLLVPIVRIPRRQPALENQPR